MFPGSVSGMYSQCEIGRFRLWRSTWMGSDTISVGITIWVVAGISKTRGAIRQPSLTFVVRVKETKLTGRTDPPCEMLILINHPRTELSYSVRSRTAPRWWWFDIALTNRCKAGIYMNSYLYQHEYWESHSWLLIVDDVNHNNWNYVCSGSVHEFQCKSF